MWTATQKGEYGGISLEGVFTEELVLELPEDANEALEAIYRLPEVHRLQAL